MDDDWRRQMALVLVMARRRYSLRHPGRVTNAKWAAALTEITGLGIAPQTISKWEAAKHDPPGGVVLAALILAGVDLDLVLQPKPADHIARLRALIGDDPSQ